MNELKLPTQPVKAERKSPKSIIIFGQSKIGKTTLLSKLNNCLIIDTENGTDYIEALKVKANSYQDLLKIYKALQASDAPQYDYIALDTVDKIYEWCEALTINEYNKSNPDAPIADIGGIPYGAGYGVVRGKVMNIINAFNKISKHLIIIGHLKKSLVGSELVEVITSSLDLTGKMKNILMADVDAIGLIYRKEGNVRISFKTSDELEAGSRCEHLKGKDFEFSWDKIYLD